MPAVVLALWPLLLTVLQTLVSYLLGRGVFESLLLVGIRKYCKRWPNGTVIELAIALAESVDKRHLLGDLQVPPDHVPSATSRSRSQAGFTSGAFVALICIVGVSMTIGYAFGVRHSRPLLAAITAKSAEVLPGGGLRLETTVNPAVKPAQPVAKGSRVAATGQIKVRPKPVKKGGEGGKDSGAVMDGPSVACSCAEISIDYTQTIDKDGQPGMQASTEGGTVTGGYHSPVLGEFRGSPRRHALGVTWRPEIGGEPVIGVIYQRDVWERLRVGAKVEYEKEKGLQGELQALFRY